ncbi:MAG: PIN domain-containing protein [Terriglobales bacterium]
MIAALDTNLLAYAEGVNGLVRQREARQIIDGAADRIVLPAIVLAELFHVLTRKGRRTHEQAHVAAQKWRSGYPVVENDRWLNAALDLAAAHRLGIWDAAILDAAADAGCALLLSEDMQHGFRWRGVTVVDPFAHPDHPLLIELLERS